MKKSILSLCLICVFGTVVANTENPYRSIVSRNAFRLQDPTVEPPKVEEPTVVAPPEDLDVTLTGFATVDGESEAYFMIPKKNEAGKFTYFSLSEGDAKHSVEVIKLDALAGTVQIKQNFKTFSLNLEDNGFSSSKPRQVATRRNPRARGAVPPSSPAKPPSANVASGPRIIGRGGVVNGGADGQTTSIQQTAPPPVSSTAAALRSANGRTGPAVSIPPRSRRGPSLPRLPEGMTAEEQAALTLIDGERMEIEQNIPAPPLPFSLD